MTSHEEIIHARDDEGDHQQQGGLTDMDVVIDPPFPAAFGEEEEEISQEVVQQAVVGHHHHQDREIYGLLDDVNDVSNAAAAMFYTDFPSPHEFPCMSSSSSSPSSAPVPSRPVASSSTTSSSASSSSATSWFVFRPETDEYSNNTHPDHQNTHDAAAAGAALSSTSLMEFPLPPPAPVPLENGNPDNRDADCINLMENFGYMDLLDSSNIWDLSSIFESESPQPPQLLQQQPFHRGEEQFFQERQQTSRLLLNQNMSHQEEEEEGEGGGGDDGLYFLQGNSELALIFLEWLKQNKDYISAQDIRSIKLKRSTIECASKRLGSTKEGKKQLLKLILEWVEQYQLQKNRVRETDMDPATNHHHHHHHHHLPAHEQPINPNNPNSAPDDMNCNLDPNVCFSPSSTWVPNPPPPPPCVQDPGVTAAFPPTMGGGGYVCEIPHSGAPSQSVNGSFFPPTSADQYHQPAPMDTQQSWNVNATPTYVMGSHSQFNPFPVPDTSAVTSNANAAAVAAVTGSHSHAQAVYGNPYPYPPVFDSNTGERLGSSATKEARKKRMARQRRISLHQYRHHRQHHNVNHQQNQSPQDMMMSEQVHAAGVVEDCTSSQANPAGNWIYWPTAAPPASATMPSSAQTQSPVDRSTMQPQNHQQRSQQLPADRKQDWKTEKNLKFLLQKVLKQSDVGNLGRIVLPKKEAETHLPELDSRDGIPIAMADIGTSNVWNMRYRFWPNNKSRMYLLENTGDFVRVNGLQEGDFIVIYSDTKCGKYLIRGVKVRQPGSKFEVKKPAKKSLRNTPQAAANHSLASLKQTVT